MSLGHAVRVLRAIRGLRQGDLARLLGVDPSHVSLVEAGRRGMSPALRAIFCQALDCPPHLLSCLAGEWPPDDAARAQLAAFTFPPARKPGPDKSGKSRA